MLNPPELWPSVATPPDEVNSIKELYSNLWGVFYNAEAWSSALQLFTFAQSRPIGVSPALARKWRFIAAHECVHQLHHLRERLSLIKGHKLRACPSLRNHIDTDSAKAATRKLDQYFPDIDALRNAIAHSGAHEVRPEEHMPEDGWLMTHLEPNGRFSAPYEGKVRILYVSDESLRHIEEVCSDFLGSFRDAARLLERQGYAD